MSLRRLKMIAGAGEPDDVIPLRIDIVTIAGQLRDAVSDTQSPWSVREHLINQCHDALCRAVNRYRSAIKRRGKSSPVSAPEGAKP